jgi:type I restriction enzyme S subunit
MALSGFVTALAKGVRERSTDFRWADASVLNLPCPPLREQAAIVDIVNRETTKIDDLVAEKRRLIELLKEKRQAIISRAVTKGLSPNARTKDSGVEWLGDVPAHWDVRRIRFLCKIGTGDADTANAVDGGEYPFFVRSAVVERISEYTHDCEAVLTAGDGAGVGKVYHHFKGKFRAHQRVYIFSDFSDVIGRFFYFYMSEMFAKVVLEGTAKSTVDSLRRPMIADFLMTVPPYQEQERIVAEIERVVAQIDALTAEAETGILLLKERRAAFISAAVTGKIDVRAAATQRAEAA